MSERTTPSNRITYYSSLVNPIVVSLRMILWPALIAGCSGPPKHLAIPVRPKVVQPAPAAAVQPPKPDDAALLFPHHVGDHWTMTVTGEEESHQIEVTVKAGPDMPGVQTFYLQTTRDGKAVTRDLYEENENGLFFVASDLPEPTKIVPPMPLLKRPVHPNTEWEWIGTFKVGAHEWPATAKLKLTGPDSLKTPGGEYEAFKLEQSVTVKAGGQDIVSKTMQWLAPKVGTVKQITQNPNEKGEAVLISSKLTE